MINRAHLILTPRGECDTVNLSLPLFLLSSPTRQVQVKRRSYTISSAEVSFPSKGFTFDYIYSLKYNVNATHQLSVNYTAVIKGDL